MLISRDWIQEFVPGLSDREDPKILSELLTLHTVEVEGWIDYSKELSGIFVGEILSIKKHPNADKLSVARVKSGEKELQIVFGSAAPVEVGMKVPVAVAPAFIFGGKKIEKTVFRGMESQGMMCLEQEMGIKKTGISFPDLSGSKSGVQINQALNLYDVVFDIENKSITHRPDLWGIYGMAREIAAIKGLKLKEFPYAEIKGAAGSKFSAKVEDKELCLRYIVVEIADIDGSAAAPSWMQRRLEISGIRSINAVVDVTNYVMLETGQPMHSFDAQKIKGKKIIVKKAHKGEKIKTIDGTERVLLDSMLVISDEAGCLAIAGVMGGLESAVSSGTTSVVLEAATFDGPSIRKTAKKLGLRTDSAARFEKSLDPHLPQIALSRAVQLLKEIFPKARIISKVIDVKSFKEKENAIKIQYDFIFRKIGIALEPKKIIQLLSSIGFYVKFSKNEFLINVPSWRSTGDISIKEDVVEEVARLYGYDKIQPALPEAGLRKSEIFLESQIQRKTLQVISEGFKFVEAKHYSFLSENDIRLFGDSLDDYIKLSNPVSASNQFLRRNLFIWLLKSVEANQHSFDEIKMFETGKVFLKEFGGQRASPKNNGLLPYQPEMFSAVFCKKGEKNPWFIIRNAACYLAESCFNEFSLKPVKEIPHFVHRGRIGAILISDIAIGKIFEFAPPVLRKLGIKERVAGMELNLTEAAPLFNKNATAAYKKILKFPGVERDISLVVPEHVPQEEILKTIHDISEFIYEIELFDIYRENTEQKNLAYHLTFVHPEKTLQMDEVDVIFEKIIKEVSKKFKASLHA